MTANRGMKMIKVSGILMVIFGGLGALFGIGAFLASLTGSMLYDPVQQIFAIISTAASIYIGVYGIQNADKTEMAQNIVIMGVILLALRIVGVVTSIFQIMSLDPFASLDPEIAEFAYPIFIVSLVIGTVIGAAFACVLPILYIVGGNMNKKSGVPLQLPPGNAEQ